jgi:S-(hydroxymethyl)glutathione dehydrogenase/alcohol dehydrogenase
MCSKVIVTVGELDGREVDKWMGITAKGGTCVLTAMGSLAANETTNNVSLLGLLQKNLQGTLFGGGNPQHDIPLLLSMYKIGKLNIDDMITKVYSLAQINDGYRDMLDGKNIRGVIRFTEEEW